LCASESAVASHSNKILCILLALISVLNIDRREMADIEAMLGLAKKRDAAAFGGLVRVHQSMVFSAALHFFRNAAWAEEIAQEVFLDLYRSIGAIASAEHLKAWLLRSTVRRCIDLSRKRSYSAEVPLEDSLRCATTLAVRDVFAADWLQTEVAALPEGQRAVLILRYQEELDPTDIAELLKVPLNTVKSRLHRALETLRSRLKIASAKTVKEGV
jgi:RNA polymerase sigma-70 factor (ECF subfamily)